MVDIDAVYIDAAIFEKLYHRLRKMLDANAELGYVIDPGWPSPEVFERPGWRVVECPVGAPRVELAVQRAPDGIAFAGEYAPDEMPEVEQYAIEPAVTSVVELWTDPGTLRTYGLGFNADERVLVKFKSYAYQKEV